MPSGRTRILSLTGALASWVGDTVAGESSCAATAVGLVLACRDVEAPDEDLPQASSVTASSPATPSRVPLRIEGQIVATPRPGPAPPESALLEPLSSGLPRTPRAFCGHNGTQR